MEPRVGTILSKKGYKGNPISWSGTWVELELKLQLIHSVALIAGALTYKLGIVGNSIFDHVTWEAKSQSTVKGKSKARDK